MERFESITALVTWASLAGVLYVYAGYPLLLWIGARWFARPVRRGLPDRYSVSIVLAAYNEEDAVRRRLENLLDATRDHAPEIILVSDGSTDNTATRAREFAARGVRVIELPSNVGKAVALTCGCDAAAGEIVVFTDMRQAWTPLTLPRLLRSFADERVGAVGGDLVVESCPGIMAGVGLYWRVEKWLRRQESRVHSTVGVSGSISAVRRRLFGPIPRGTLLDDVYWPLRVVMAGYRVVHDEEARVFDRLPQRPRDEFCRKVRTLSGNFQLVRLLPQSLVPWRNPIWLQFLSHKLGRLIAPWAMLGMLAGCSLREEWGYRALLGAQLVLYAVAVAGLVRPVPSRIASAAASFLVLNAAAWVAFWVWITGRAGRTWGKVRYASPTPVGQPVFAAAGAPHARGALAEQGCVDP